MLKIEKGKEESFVGFVEAFYKRMTGNITYTTRDLLDLAKWRKNLRSGTPENTVDLNLTLDMIHYIRFGKSRNSVDQMTSLYIRRDPELRENSRLAPESSGLPINYSVKLFGRDERERAEKSIRETSKRLLGKEMSSSDIWKAIPFENLDDFRYILSHLRGAVLQIRGKDFKGSPWYDPDENAKDDKVVTSNPTTPVLELVGYKA